MARPLPSSGTRRARVCCASHPIAAGFRPAAASLALAIAFTLQGGAAYAQPVPAQVIHGQASFARNGSNLLVTTTNGPGTSHSAINWKSFSVPAGSITEFLQPSATSTSINRVVAPNPSEIFGRLHSNGRLVLVNPWGIAVGEGAQVDTAGFTASTLRLSATDALAGRQRFSRGSAALQVDGRIEGRGGDVVLVAPNVGTGGAAVIESDGAVVLAAGRSVDITGRGLEGIQLRLQAGTQAVNLGTLKADAVGIFAGTLRHSGLAQAQSAEVSGGRVVLKATGDALVDGTLTARSGQRGGSVDVFGERVGLLAGAQVDASGSAGGGSVRIGGDYQGANRRVPNAQFTYVDAQAGIVADAIDEGDGGRVIVWAEDTTRMRGRISARGGARGGDGGFAEVSGRRSLVFTGEADLRAPAGAMGTLLLDPNDVIISGSQPTDTTSSGEIFEGGPDTAHVSAADLSAQLELSDVTVQTSGGSGSAPLGHLTLADDANVQWGSGSKLTLWADNGMTLAGQVNASSLGSANGTLHLYAAAGSIAQAAGSMLRVGSLLAEAPEGSVLLDQPNQVGVLAGQAASSEGAQFLFRNAGPLTIAPVLGVGLNDGNWEAATTVRTNTGALSVRGNVRGGTVTLQAVDGDLELQGSLEVHAQRKLSLLASGDVAVATESGDYTTWLTGHEGIEISAGGSVRMSGTWSGEGGTINASAWLQGHTGGVAIGAPGDVDFGPNTTLQTWRSPVSVGSTGGSILGAVNVTTYGTASETADGSITLTAPLGAVHFGSLHSHGSWSSPLGGKITITAGGNVQGGSIDAGGADWHESAPAANGGDVTVTSTGGNIELASVSSDGGWGVSLSSGGQGGVILLSALGTAAGTGNITVTGDLSAKGGGAGDNYDLPPSAGGRGGQITLTAGRGIAVGQLGMCNGIDASGGAGGDSYSLVGDSYVFAGTGAGGAGGTVSLSSLGGNIRVDGTIRASAADGGAGTGNGGTIDLQAPGTGVGAGSVTVTGTVEFHGGRTNAGSVGSSGGSFTVLAHRAVQLADVAGWGGPAEDDSLLAGRGGGVDITSRTRSIRLGVDGEGGSTWGEIDVSGGWADAGGRGGAGGTILLAADGASGAVLTSHDLTASGGSGYAGGGAGGSIGVSAGGRIELDDVDVSGGWDWEDRGRDGLGGSFVASTILGDVTLDNVEAGGRSGGTVVVSTGGNLLLDEIEADARYSEGAAGGTGGTIRLLALSTRAGAGSIHILDEIEADGAAASLTPGSGGMITVRAYRDILVDYSVSANAGYVDSSSTSDASGGTVLLESRVGDIVIGSSMSADGPQGGSVTVRAHQGNITADGSIRTRGSYSVGGLSGGTITLDAPGTAPGRGNIFVDGNLDAGGSYSEEAGGGRGGTIFVHADKNIEFYGAAVDGGSTYASTGLGGDGGSILVVSDNGNIRATWLSARGGNSSWAAGGSGGSIELRALGTGATAGALDIGQVYLYGGEASQGAGGSGGTFRAEAHKALHLQSVYAGGESGAGSVGPAPGGTGGDVFLSSLTSDVMVSSDLDVDGGRGTTGGAGGRIQVQAGGAVALYSVWAEGGQGWGSGSTGGNAGALEVQAGGNIDIGDGGMGLGGGAGDDGPGGAGGRVTLHSTGGGVTLSDPLELPGGAGSVGGSGGVVDLRVATHILVPDIAVDGGAAASSTGGAAGGAGGSVLLRFGTSLITHVISASGASGQSGAEGHVDGGPGGRGGSIDIARSAADTGVIQAIHLLAQGGSGGAGHPGSTGAGGAGGDGGTITVTAQGGGLMLPGSESVEPSDMLAGSGEGGASGDSGSLGPSGAPGQVNLAASADLTIEALNLSPRAGLSAQAGGSLSVGIPLDTEGAAVTLQGTTVTLAGAIDTTGGSASSVAFSVASVPTGGDVTITADQLDLQASVNAGTADVIIRPLTATRATRLGGSDDSSTLHLAQAEINRITAGTLVVGDALNSGGVNIAGRLTIDPALVQELSLLNEGAITQAGGTALAVQNLNADGGSVDLGNVTVSMLSGRARTGAFSIDSRGSGPLAISTVDGTSGVAAAGPVTIRARGALELSEGITSGASGDAVVLVGSHLFASSTANLDTPAGRWLVYLDSHEGNDFGTLRSGNHALWGRSFAADPPAGVTEAGNRYLFGNRPQLDLFAEAATKVYDGNANFTLAFRATGFVDAAAFQDAFSQDDLGIFSGALALQDPGKNVGSYDIVRGTLASAYAVRSFTGNTATITPAPLTLSGLSASKVYDGTTAATLGGTATFVGMVAGDDLVFSGGTGTYDNRNVGTGKPVTVTGIDLGGADARNYELTLPGGVSGTITPASLVLSGVTANDKVYDGGTAATLSGGALLGVFGSDQVRFSAGAASFGDRNAGTAKPVTVAGWTLGGSDAGNYVLAGTPTSLSASITPAPLTLGGVTANDKVYDGTTVATLSGGALLGVIGGDQVRFSAGTASFGDRNAGTAKPVTVAGWTLGGSDAGNYMLAGTPTSLSASITPAPLTLGGVTANDKVYDGTTVATLSGGALVGVIGGDQVRFSAGAASFGDRNAGTRKPVTVAGWTLGGSDAGNYMLAGTPTSLSADITPALLTLGGLTATDKVYDGSTAATLSGGALLGVIGGDRVGFSASTATFADANAGQDKAVTLGSLGLTGADAANYRLQGTPALRADITPAPLTIHADNLSKREGETLTFAGTEFSPKTTGIGSETLTSVVLTSAGAAAGARPGAYAIVPSAATGSNGFLASNYDITYLNGALAVFARETLPPEQVNPVRQVNNQVVTFATLFVQEAKTQPSLEVPAHRRRNKGEEGKDDLVVVDENACKR